jgi:hypothetical protein
LYEYDAAQRVARTADNSWFSTFVRTGLENFLLITQGFGGGNILKEIDCGENLGVDGRIV